MRICLVSQEYPPETANGGIGAQTYMKAHGLARLGHQIHVLSHSIDGAQHEYRDGAVEITRIPGPDTRLTIHTDVARWIGYSIEVAAALEALHERLPLDLIDFPEWASEGYFYLLNRSATGSPAVVLHLHGPLVMFGKRLGWPELDSELYRSGVAMESACFRMADQVFSSSICSATWSTEHYGARDIPVLHTGVDRSHFCPTDAVRDERPTILFVGKIAHNKGVDELLDAAIFVAQRWPRLRLRFVGRGDERVIRSLKDRASSAGYPEMLEIAGYVQRSDLPAEFARADVFAAPSEYEGGPGFVYLEAMACGIPVVACSGSGASEAVTHGETGILVPPKDARSLGTAMERLLCDRDLRESLRSKALQFIAQEADSEECLRRLETFYKSVLRSRPVSARWHVRCHYHGT